MIFRITAKSEADQILESKDMVGTEDEADALVDEWSEKWPDARINWLEIEERMGVLDFGKDHPLTGLAASFFQKKNDGTIDVRILASRGVFRPGHIIQVEIGCWVEK